MDPIKQKNNGLIDFNSEIDLSLLLKTILKKKWLIINLTFISSLFTLIYAIFFTNKTYTVLLPYKVNINSFINKEFCNERARCMSIKTNQNIRTKLSNIWNPYLVSTVNSKISAVQDYKLLLSASLKDLNKIKNLDKELINAEANLKKEFIEANNLTINYMNNIKEASVLSTDNYISHLIIANELKNFLDVDKNFPIKFKNYYLSQVDFKPSSQFSYPFINVENINPNSRYKKIVSNANRITLYRIIDIGIRGLIAYSLLFTIIVLYIFNKENN